MNSKIPEGSVGQKWTDYKDHVPLVNPANKRNLEILIVGSGLAGASAAASLAERGTRPPQGRAGTSRRTHLRRIAPRARGWRAPSRKGP